MNTEEPREVAFFGRITAGFTHEMKNVLAIVKESAGLMQDLLLMSRGEPSAHHDRFMRVLSTIQEQVRRGVELSNRLNRFAHSPDELIRVVDLGDVIEQMTALGERFARLRGVVLKALGGDGPVCVVTCPVRLQMALFLGMECCWNQMEPGGELTLTVQTPAGSPTVSVSCAGRGDAEDFILRVTRDPKWAAFAHVARSLGGEVHADPSMCGFRLAFPREAK